MIPYFFTCYHCDILYDEILLFLWLTGTGPFSMFLMCLSVWCIHDLLSLIQNTPAILSTPLAGLNINLLLSLKRNYHFNSCIRAPSPTPWSLLQFLLWYSILFTPWVLPVITSPYCPLLLPLHFGFPVQQNHHWRDEAYLFLSWIAWWQIVTFAMVADPSLWCR